MLAAEDVRRTPTQCFTTIFASAAGSRARGWGGWCHVRLVRLWGPSWARLTGQRAGGFTKSYHPVRFDGRARASSTGRGPAFSPPLSGAFDDAMAVSELVRELAGLQNGPPDSLGEQRALREEVRAELTAPFPAVRRGDQGSRLIAYLLARQARPILACALVKQSPAGTSI